MKKLIPLILLALVCGCKELDLAGGDFAPPYSASVGGSGRELTLQPASPLTASLQQWVQTNSTGWSKSMVTYAPGIVVRNKNFTMNFIQGAVVLNFKPDPTKADWIQVVKDCDTSRLRFVNDIRTEAEQSAPPLPPAPQTGPSEGAR